MGYAVAGNCYATQTEAKDAFLSMYPITSNGISISLYHYPAGGADVNFSNPHNKIVFRVIGKNYIDNKTFLRDDYAYLGLCEVPTINPFSPIAASGIFAFFFASIITVWVIAKSSGVIMSVIRKF